MKNILYIVFFIFIISNTTYAQKRPIDRSLFRAIKANDINEVKKLIKLDANVNSTDENGATTLMWAVLNADIKMVNLLVKSGVNVKAKGIIFLNEDKTSFYGSPLSIAAGTGKLDIVKYLIEKCGISVNDRQLTIDKKETGWGALHEACQNGNIEIIEYLFSKGADKNLQTLEFFKPKSPTPLICAVRSGKIDVVKVVLNKKPRIDAVDENDISALGYATLSGKMELVKLLVESGADVNLPIFSGAGYLMFAAYANNSEMFKYFIYKGVDPRKTNNIVYNDASVYTLTAMCAAKGNNELVAYCLDSLKLDINQQSMIVNDKEKLFMSALNIAVWNKNEETVRYLIQRGADVNLSEPIYGISPLMYASFKNSPQIVKILIDNGANCNYQSKDGYSALIIAVRDNYEEVYKYLIEMNADPTLMDKNAFGVYYYALKNNTSFVIQFIDSKLETTANTWKYPENLLFQALLINDFNRAEKLLKLGFIKKTNDKEWNAINYAIKSGNPALVDLVLQYDKTLNVQTGTTNPLCLAMNTNRIIAENLIQKGADVNLKSVSGELPLILAINDSTYKLLNLILSKNADINQKNDTGLTAFEYAIGKNNFLAVKALAAIGADINKAGYKGMSSVDFAKSVNASDIIIEFLKKPEFDFSEFVNVGLEICIVKIAEKNPEKLNAKEKNGNYFIFNLINTNNIFVFKSLGKNFNLNVQDSQGRTPLYYAIYRGNIEFAQELLKFSPDFNIKSNKGDNCLELSIEYGYSEIVNLLKSLGAKSRSNIAVQPELYVSVGHTQGIVAMDISSDGKYMLSFGQDDRVILWETSTGKEIRKYENLRWNSGDEKNRFFKNSVNFSPDGNRFLVSGEETYEIDIRTGEILRKFNATGNARYSPDGKYICSGGGDMNNITYSPKIFDANSGKVVFDLYSVNEFRENDDNVNYLIGFAGFTNDSKYAIMSSLSDLIFVDLNNFSIYKRFIANGLHSFSVSGNYFINSFDREVRCVSIDSNKILYRFNQPGAIACLSPDGKLLAVGGHDQLVILYNAVTGEKLKEMFGHDHYISAIEFSPDSRYLYTSSRDKTIIKWNISTGEKVKIFGGRTWQARNISFSPDGKYLISTGNDYSVKIWNMAQITEVKNVTGHKGALFGFTFSPDSSSVLTYAEDRIPRLWDFSTGERKMIFKTHNQVVLGAGFSPDGKYFFSYSNDRKVIVWEIATGKKTIVLNQALPTNKAHIIAENQNPSTLYCFSADSKYFFAYDSSNFNNTSVFVYDVTNGRQINQINVLPNSFETVKAIPRQLSLSVDGKYLICGFYSKNGNSEVHFLDINTFKSVKVLSFAGDFKRVVFSSDFKRMIVYNDYSSEVKLLDIDKNLIIATLKDSRIDELNNPFSPDNKNFAVWFKNKISVVNSNDGLVIYSFKEFNSKILSTGFSPDGNFLVCCSEDNMIKIYDIKSAKLLLNLIQFDKNDWVVSNTDGLFDASANAMKLLYYTSGLRLIDLDQMKERYYEPNLLPKALGFNKEKIRNVESLSEVSLFPDVNLGLTNTNLVIDLKNQGGGIGKVVILVNGKEVASDARGPKPNPQADKLKINFDLKNHPYLKAGKENIIEVKAYNAEGYLVSRGAAVSYTPPSTSGLKPPHIYIVSCGVSDYTGDQIDLKYAAKDAEDVANALKIGGERLFGAENTHIYLLSTNNKDLSMHPTKANIFRVFAEIASKSISSDVFILYLSGHGINWGGQDGDFYYLTKDAFTASIDAYNDPKIRSASTISSAELTDQFKKIPALKQVLMIDACASGKAVENLMAKRDISASTLRALDRMKDRVGMYIITGCTADAVSYEASKFGQGLLTYSLLEGIKGFALRDESFIDVAMLFTRAQERVPELAADIGGIQKPQVFSPYGSQSFDIGELSEEDKKMITLAQPKPMFLMSVFLEEESMDDILGLEKMVDDAFRNVASKGYSNLIFIQAKEFPDAYRIRGQYSVSGNEVEVRINVFKGKEKAGSFTVKGNSDKIDSLVSEIIEKASQISK